MLYKVANTIQFLLGPLLFTVTVTMTRLEYCANDFTSSLFLFECACIYRIESNSNIPTDSYLFDVSDDCLIAYGLSWIMCELILKHRILLDDCLNTFSCRIVLVPLKIREKGEEMRPVDSVDGHKQLKNLKEVVHARSMCLSRHSIFGDCLS